MSSWSLSGITWLLVSLRAIQSVWEWVLESVTAEDWGQPPRVNLYLAFWSLTAWDVAASYLTNFCNCYQEDMTDFGLIKSWVQVPTSKFATSWLLAQVRLLNLTDLQLFHQEQDWSLSCFEGLLWGLTTCSMREPLAQSLEYRRCRGPSPCPSFLTQPGQWGQAWPGQLSPFCKWRSLFSRD